MADETPSQHKQAAGCVVTKDDIPYVIASFSCCLIFIVYGASAASLGPALPALSQHYGKSISEMGATFTSRGVGYLIGTLFSAWVLSFKNIPYSKEFMAATSELVCGLSLIFITQTNNFALCVVLFFVQGITYGMIDTLTNCALPEMWGRRVGPWMQAMHSCFGIGAIIGPALIGGFGYGVDFYVIAVSSLLPFLSIVLSNFLGYGNKKVNSDSAEGSGNEGESDASTQEGEGEGRAAPLSFKLIVSLFFFIYVGAETGFAGWIPSYSLIEDVTQSDSKAAYLSAIFWAALTAGRILAIPTAIFLSSSSMIRVQLALGVITGFLSLTILTSSYSIASFVSGFAGFSLAAMFPVMMTIFGDYGYKVDANSTTMFMVGATMGESIIPVCIGFLMSYIDPYMMPVTIFVCVIALLVLYLAFHLLSMQEQREYRRLRFEDSEHKGLVGADVLNPVAKDQGGRAAFTILAEEDDEVEDEEVEGVEMVQFHVIPNSDQTDASSD